MQAVLRGAAARWRVPSRRMPAWQPEALPRRAWVPAVLAALCVVVALVGLVMVAWETPGVALFALALVILLAGVARRDIRRDARRWARLVAARPGADMGLCAFARAADCRQNDPWIVRAVYEEALHHLTQGGVRPGCALRWEDRATADLYVDFDATDEVARRAAQRAGRSLANVQRNPWFGRVRTLGDLVGLLQAQPIHPASARAGAGTGA